MAKSAVILVVIAMVLCVNAGPLPQSLDPSAFVHNFMNQVGFGSFNTMMASNSALGTGTIDGVSITTIQKAGQQPITSVWSSNGGKVEKQTYVGNSLVTSN